MDTKKTENKSAAPAKAASAPAAPLTLEENNAAADKRQSESQKAAQAGGTPSVQELAKSGYIFPEGHFDQPDPNAGQPSTEQRSGDGGASLSEK